VERISVEKEGVLDLGKCTRLLVQIVAKRQKSLSSLQKADQSIAEIAIRSIEKINSKLDSLVIL
jgi:hypothetical protein